jgi:hypothetical protein
MAQSRAESPPWRRPRLRGSLAGAGTNAWTPPAGTGHCGIVVTSTIGGADAERDNSGRRCPPAPRMGDFGGARKAGRSVKTASCQSIAARGGQPSYAQRSRGRKKWPYRCLNRVVVTTRLRHNYSFILIAAERAVVIRISLWPCGHARRNHSLIRPGAVRRVRCDVIDSSGKFRFPNRRHRMMNPGDVFFRIHCCVGSLTSLRDR